MTKRLRILAALFVISVVLNAFAIVGMMEVLEQNRELSVRVSALTQELDSTKTQLQYYRSQAEHYSSLLEALKGGESVVGEAIINLVAVKAVRRRPFEVSYEGVTMTCRVELREGSGRVLVNTVPRIGIDLQTSSNIAVFVAENLTGARLGETDTIITIEAEEPVEVVDGPSAGAAITIATMAAINGYALNERVFITGTINPDGSIGVVGGIIEKAVAAASKGGTIFLVPEGQRVLTVLERVEHSPLPGVTIIELRPTKVDLQDYLRQEGYETVVMEVEHVMDAYKIFTS
jgi:predicted S18 family serine protease